MSPSRVILRGLVPDVYDHFLYPRATTDSFDTDFNNAQRDYNSTRKAISGGIIAAIVICIVVCLGICIGGAFCCGRMRRRKKTRDEESKKAMEGKSIPGTTAGWQYQAPQTQTDSTTTRQGDHAGAQIDGSPVSQLDGVEVSPSPVQIDGNEQRAQLDSTEISTNDDTTRQNGQTKAPNQVHELES